jgi:hypothetical protein
VHSGITDGVRYWSWRDLVILFATGPPLVGFVWACFSPAEIQVRWTVTFTSTAWILIAAGWRPARALLESRRHLKGRQS